MKCPGCNKEITPEPVESSYSDAIRWECSDCGIYIIKNEISYFKCAVEIKKDLALIKKRLDCAKHSVLKGGEANA